MHMCRKNAELLLSELKLQKAARNRIPTAVASLQEALMRFALSTLSGAWSLLTLAALAFFLSVIANSAVVSVIAAILIYVILSIIGRVEFFSDIKTYFFTTDMDFWRVVFKPDIPWREVAYSASRCGVYIFSFVLASVILFDRKDISN